MINKNLSENKSVKQNLGITLIALVVSVIVLIILAGVSINIVLGDNGIIAKSKETKEKVIMAEAKETIRLLVLEYERGSQENTLAFFLEEKIPEQIDAVIYNEDGTLTVYKNGYSEIVGEEYEYYNYNDYVIWLGVTANSYLTNYPSAPISFSIVGEKDGEIVYNDIVCLEIDGAGSYQEEINLFVEEGTEVTVTPLYTGNSDITLYNENGNGNNNVEQTIELSYGGGVETIEYSLDYNGGLISSTYLELDLEYDESGEGTITIK